MKDGTMQYHAWTLLRQAESWAKDAKIKIREADRMDAMDSIRMAEKSLMQAKHVIDQTFFPVNEPKWPKL